MVLATTSLGTTTFATTVEPSDTLVNLASVSGVSVGTRLYCDREMMAVSGLTGIGTQVLVRRGGGGTASARHATNAPVWIGLGHQFYDNDPVGLPPVTMLVYPYINVLTGQAWVAVGDEVGPGNAGRIWQPVSTAVVAGALGNSQVVVTTPGATSAG